MDTKEFERKNTRRTVKELKKELEGIDENCYFHTFLDGIIITKANYSKDYLYYNSVKIIDAPE